MTESAITVSKLGKQYRLGEHVGDYQTLRDTISGFVSRTYRRLSSANTTKIKHTPPTFWALNNVSFEVGRGEVVGIIGRNGAGKTTLLKILSRITQPTRGRVELIGRVGSLLEVGTGFHPELTGRENIYLNGAILGMTRSEIAKKFDEIVEFAGVKKFIDTPVKRYSSGMGTRLAFSVAAHTEPEILLVDEVLAVGDLAFQKKCLGKMNRVAEAGRTILFVSHNMQAVRNLCPRSILIEEGQVEFDGPTADTIDRFNSLLRTQKVSAETALRHPEHRRGDGKVRFTSIEILDGAGRKCFTFQMHENVCFRLSFEVFNQIEELEVAVGLRSSLSGDFVTTVRHTVVDTISSVGTVGSITIELPEITIRPGQYPLYFWLGNGTARPYDVVDDLTAPLVIGAKPESADLDRVAEVLVGYVSIPSQVRSIEIEP